MSNTSRRDASTCVDVEDLILIAKMRVVLALAVLLTLMVAPSELDGPQPVTMMVLSAYTLQSFAVLIFWHTGQAMHHPRLSHWLDVCWFTVLLAVTGPLAGVFVLFFFAIAIAAFRWGYDEGARVTLACTFLYLLSCIGQADSALQAHVLLRAIFLLALGRMVSHWGEALLDNRRRLALLRDVSRLSNPRFGVDHTIASVLEQTRQFFDAASCLLLIRDHDMATWRLRSTREGERPFAVGADLDERVANVLAGLAPRSCTVYISPWRHCGEWGERLLVRDDATGNWQRMTPGAGRELADMIGARSVICVPIPLRDDEGRIFVVSTRRDLRMADAAFLAQVAAQAFPAIENIALLDRMASEAGRRERQRFSNDLHDSAVQPYIGLSHALHGLLRDAGADTPLGGKLRQVADMADSIVRDLRRFASAARNASACGESAFLQALRNQADHFKTYHNLEISLNGDEPLDISDRLGAEVIQLIREGMSNIRRHTAAHRGAVRLRREDGWLHILIENECTDGPAAPFTPRSIAERAASLGGVAYVGCSSNATTVHVDIPL